MLHKKHPWQDHVEQSIEILDDPKANSGVVVKVNYDDQDPSSSGTVYAEIPLSDEELSALLRNVWMARHRARQRKLTLRLYGALLGFMDPWRMR